MYDNYFFTFKMFFFTFKICNFIIELPCITNGKQITWGYAIAHIIVIACISGAYWENQFLIDQFLLK